MKNFAKIWGISREDIADLLNRVNEEMNKYNFFLLNILLG